MDEKLLLLLVTFHQLEKTVTDLSTRAETKFQTLQFSFMTHFPQKHLQVGAKHKTGVFLVRQFITVTNNSPATHNQLQQADNGVIGAKYSTSKVLFCF